MGHLRYVLMCYLTGKVVRIFTIYTVKIYRKLKHTIVMITYRNTVLQIKKLSPVILLGNACLLENSFDIQSNYYLS